MKKVLFIDTLDFESFPPGGTLNFARQMLGAFGNRLCLVGVATDDTPIGEWVKKDIDGVTYDFFAIGRRRATSGRPLIPPRLTGYLHLRRFREAIMSLGVRVAFMQTHEAVMATSGWRWDDLCFRFPGVENPLAISRYPGARWLDGAFDRVFFPAVGRADVILAAADRTAINEMVDRSRGVIGRRQVVQFPTRVDTSVFQPAPKPECKRKKGYGEDAIVVATCGRIHWAKGWKFLLDAFRLFRQSCADAYLVFIGDGQDRVKLEGYAKEAGLADCVRVTGFQTPPEVAAHLNAADLYVTGSLREGWSTAMVEALACGLPIVSTDVSSAREIVTNDRNGYVVTDRNEEKFLEAIRKALQLDGVREFSDIESERYALRYFRRDLEKVFPPLRLNGA